MLTSKFYVLLLLVFAPFTMSVLYGATTHHKSQHMLPDETRIINLNSQCMENKNPDEDKNNDNPHGPSQLEFNLPDSSNCFQAYETDSCNQNSSKYTGAYLQYLNASKRFSLKLEKKVRKTEDERVDKLQNFNFFPKAFQACEPDDLDGTKILEDACELSINFKIHYQVETKQVPKIQNLETQIKTESCLDIPFTPILKENEDLIWFEINVIRNNPTQENTIICLELFTQKNCQGSGVRMVLPQQSQLWNNKHDSARIWEYSKESGDPNELIHSIRRCSYCLERNISENSSKIHQISVVSKDRVLTIIGISASIVFAILVMLLVFLVLRMRKKRRIRANRETFSFKRLQDQHSINSPSGQNISTQRAAGLTELCTLFSESYEIPRAEINIGDVNSNKEISIIGAGEYTVLYKGRYQTDGRTVTIKTIKKGHGNDMVMRNALEECQILMHLGKHPGIVEFLGVCTNNLAKGELFVVMEWCEKGTLKGYLNQNKGQFISLVKDGEWMNEIENRLEAQGQVDQQGNLHKIKFSTVTLFKWCCEVAEAMEFISSRNIVHVSLSSKNVLLDENLSCKISDFRSAKMPAEWSESDSSNPFSMKRRQIPWRWYAVESLIDEVFSTQTDIWTFGIFVWEVFSLGITPYPDYIFGPEFILCIKHGYRLQIPNEATVEIYQLMLTCWYDDPEKRPAFSKVKHKLIAMSPRKCVENQN